MSAILAPRGFESKAITLEKLKRFEEFEAILKDNGWTLACLRCRNPLKGDNHPSGTRLSVSCQCHEVVFDAARP